MPPLEDENQNIERNIQMDPFFSNFTMHFTGIKDDTHLSVETMEITQIGVKSLSLAIDVRLGFDSGFSL